MDLVSILIPIYNVEKYLDRCVASAVQQSYGMLEIILVDDGSTDRSAQICNDWAKKDSRIRVIHQHNSGVSAARNTGLQAASGEWIIQLDSDDYFATYAVETMIRTAEENQVDMVVCDFKKGSEDVFQFERIENPTIVISDAVTTIFRIYSGDHDALRFVVPWCKMSRKFLYEGICYPTGRIFEDIFTTHKLLYRCERIAVLDEPLFYYFQRPGSIMNAAFSMKKLDYLQALVERVEFFASHGLSELKSIAYDELLHSLIWEYSRTRDMLHSREGMEYVTTLFRQVYKKGYASRRYPSETAIFLAAFNRNPEWVVLYWRITGKLKRIFKMNG